MAHPGDVVGRYQAALDGGDTDALVSTFAPDGYYREPIWPPTVHRGASELRAFFSTRFSAGGGIGLEHCAVTDDGMRCALEYNCVRWGTFELPLQAGIAVFERCPDGLLVAVRVSGPPKWRTFRMPRCAVDPTREPYGWVLHRPLSVARFGVLVLRASNLHLVV